jgi:hypothetical protein
MQYNKDYDPTIKYSDIKHIPNYTTNADFIILRTLLRYEIRLTI